MDRQEIILELKNIIGDFLKIQGLELIGLIYRHEGRDLALRILVDRAQGGITLGECAQLNNQISEILDEKDILQEGYILEVSSPGLDRPLETRSDFLRCMNRKVKLFLNESINGKIELEGLISKVEDDSVYIDCKNATIQIPLIKINKAKEIIE